MDYTTPRWKRDLTIGVARQLGGRQRDVAMAGFIVHQADIQFGFSEGFSSLPPEAQEAPDSVAYDLEGNRMPNAFVEAKERFWTSVTKIVRTGGAENTKQVRAALKERARYAWLHLERPQVGIAMLLGVEAMQQVREEGLDLTSKELEEGWGRAEIEDDFTMTRYSVPFGDR